MFGIPVPLRTGSSCYPESGSSSSDLYQRFTGHKGRLSEACVQVAASPHSNMKRPRCSHTVLAFSATKRSRVTYPQKRLTQRSGASLSEAIDTGV